MLCLLSLTGNCIGNGDCFRWRLWILLNWSRAADFTGILRGTSGSLWGTIWWNVQITRLSGLSVQFSTYLHKTWWTPFALHCGEQYLWFVCSSDEWAEGAAGCSGIGTLKFLTTRTTLHGRPNNDRQSDCVIAWQIKARRIIITDRWKRSVQTRICKKLKCVEVFIQMPVLQNSFGRAVRVGIGSIMRMLLLMEL